MSRYRLAGPYDIKAGDLARHFYGPIGAVACLGKLLALSGAGIQGTDLLVVMRERQDQPLLIKGKDDPVDAVSFLVNSSQEICLLSCSQSFLVIYTISPDPLGLMRTIVLSEERETGPISCCQVDPFSVLCAVAAGRSVKVWRFSMDQGLLADLRGHRGTVTNVAFVACYPELLVTCSHDKSFKVWNLSQRACVFQSMPLPGDALLCLASHPTEGKLAIATSGAQVLMYDINPDGTSCRETTRFRLDRIPKPPLDIISESMRLREAPVHQDSIPLRLDFLDAPGEPLSLLVTCTDVLAIFSLDGHLLYRPSQVDDDSPVAFSCSHVQVARACEEGASEIVSLDPFQPTISLHYLLPPTEAPSINCKSSPLSFFPSASDAPLPSSSPLLGHFETRVVSKEKNLAYDNMSRTVTTKPNAKGVPADQPIVFHTRIRSSGYGQKIKAKSATGKVTGKSPAAAAASSRLRKEYPLCCGPLIIEQLQSCPMPRLGPILHLTYSGDAKTLAASCTDGTVHTYRLPILRHQGDGRSFGDHKVPVRSLNFSHDNTLLLTSSDDGTSNIYLLQPARSSPCVTFRPFPAASSIPPPPSPCASFFYLDKFVLQASGPSLTLWKYQIDMPSRSQLVRAPPPGQTTSLHRWSPAWHKLTALSCLNSHHSPHILVAGSDRRLLVLDAHTGSSLREFSNTHSKAIHTLDIPQPSGHVMLPLSHYDVFLSAAADGAIKLWDLRAGCSVVASFRDGHVNRRDRLGVAWSPCLRYIAAGSEDKSGVLYDIRAGKLCAKLASHQDVVSTVAYNPLHPQLVTGSYDGSMRFFTE